MRRCWSCLVGLMLVAASLQAQGLRDKISELFIFTAGQDPLFLGGTAGSDSATALHADHFIPAARAENGTLISFLSNAISGNVANLPVSATSGGSTFRFEGGVPVRTSVSRGPVFAERGQTLGRGRVFVGANVNRMHFEALRGVSLNGIEMTFTHENVTGPACDSIVGSSCTPYGVPTHENDVIALRLALDLDMTVTSFFVSFALLGDVRFPTGSEADLLGSGHVAARGLGILSARFGAFSPHTNIGYLFQSGAFQNNAVLATVGFDHLMAPWATLAVDVVSQLQVGESKLRLPGPVTYIAPFQRTIDVTNIPNERDDQINGSLGFKFATGSGIMLVANTLWPLNRGGLRPNVLWTAGLEYNF